MKHSVRAARFRALFVALPALCAGCAAAAAPPGRGTLAWPSETDFKSLDPAPVLPHPARCRSMRLLYRRAAPLRRRLPGLGPVAGRGDAGGVRRQADLHGRLSGRASASPTAASWRPRTSPTPSSASSSPRRGRPGPGFLPTCAAPRRSSGPASRTAQRQGAGRRCATPSRCGWRGLALGRRPLRAGEAGPGLPLAADAALHLPRAARGGGAARRGVLPQPLRHRAVRPHRMAARPALRVFGATRSTPARPGPAWTPSRCSSATTA